MGGALRRRRPPHARRKSHRSSSGDGLTCHSSDSAASHGPRSSSSRSSRIAALHARMALHVLKSRSARSAAPMTAPRSSVMGRNLAPSPNKQTTRAARLARSASAIRRRSVQTSRSCALHKVSCTSTAACHQGTGAITKGSHATFQAPNVRAARATGSNGFVSRRPTASTQTRASPALIVAGQPCQSGLTCGSNYACGPTSSVFGLCTCVGAVWTASASCDAGDDASDAAGDAPSD